jgi:Domain of unknown function (DUF222)
VAGEDAYSGDGAEFDPIGEALGLIIRIDVDHLAGDELAAMVLRTEQLRNAVHALSAVVLERFEQDGEWALDGALSAAAWTAERTGSSRAGLRSRRREGAAMVRLPAVDSQARTGRLSTEHLRALSDCVRRHPELAAEHEEIWVEQAEALGAEGFRIATRQWLAAAADQADASGEAPDPVSHLHASRTLDGWLRLDGLFAPGDADLVEATLSAGVDRMLRAARDGDPSVDGQPVSVLRAGALVDLVAQAMRQEPSEISLPDRHRVAVMVQHDEPTLPTEAACDSGAYRVVLGADGEVLDVGRQTNRWPTAIRRAIIVRDRGCVFPGCDRPPSWTDIHHCAPWAEGGGTSVDNGALVCRRHHTFVHRHRWQITIDHGRPVTRRPDGMPHAVKRWQLDCRAS